jgi:hypothetical protein
MRVIVTTIVSETVPIEHRRAWRRGQQKNGRFKAQYRKKWLGTLGTLDLLWHSAGTRRNGGEQEWQAHMSVEPRDADGDVAIILSGDAGKGHEQSGPPLLAQTHTRKVGV